MLVDIHFPDPARPAVTLLDPSLTSLAFSNMVHVYHYIDLLASH